MTSQGSAHARFQRAIKRGHLLNAETAAREPGGLSLSDSLALVLLYQSRFHDSALSVLVETSQKLRLPRPTLPS